MLRVLAIIGLLITILCNSRALAENKSTDVIAELNNRTTALQKTIENELISGSGNPATLIKATEELNDIYHWQDAYTEAAQLHARTAEFFEKRGEIEIASRMRASQMEALFGLDEVDSAEAIGRRVISEFPFKLRNKSQAYNHTLVSLSDVLRRQAKHDESAALIKEALNYYADNESESFGDRAGAFDSYARILVRLKKFPEALAASQRATDLGNSDAQFRISPDFAPYLDTHARILYSFDRKVEAVVTMQRAVSILEKTPAVSSRDMALILARLSEYALGTRKIDEALAAGERGYRLAMKLVHSEQQSSGIVNSFSQVALRYAAENYLAANREANRNSKSVAIDEKEDMFAIMATSSWLSSAVEFGKIVEQLQEQDPKLKALIEVQQNNKKSLNIVTQMLASDGNSGVPMDVSKRQALEQYQQQNEQDIENISRQISKASGAASAYDFAAAPRIEDVQKALGKGQALIMYLTFRSSLNIFVVTRETSFWTSSDHATGELCGQIARFLDYFDPERQLDCVYSGTRMVARKSPSIDIYDQALSEMISERLFGNITHMLKGKSELLIVPSGPIAHVPFSALCLPHSSSNSCNGYMANRFSISILPSVDAKTIAVLKEVAVRPLRLRSAAGIGDPCVGIASGPSCTPNSAMGAATNSLRGLPAKLLSDGSAMGDVEAIRLLPYLPASRQEIIGGLAAFGDRARYYLGENALEGNIKTGQLADSDVLLFATHAVSAGDMDLLQPALVLSPPLKASAGDDGLLMASEIMQLKLKAALVFLSGCRTADTSGKRFAEPFSGLPQAFFSAGAQSLVVHQWSIDDAATAAFTREMLRQLIKSRNMSRTRALNKAVRYMMAHKNKAFRDPRVWASAQLVGLP
jgi:CHAT domain-containing protein